MATTDLIQLKQSEANKIDASVNGDYIVNLPQKILLNPGDQIAVQQSFIDTSSIDPDTGMVNIPTDCRLDIRFGLYVMDIITTNTPFVNLADELRTDGQWTGNPYIACYDATPTEDVYVLNKVTTNTTGRPALGNEFRVDVTYTWTDQNNAPQTFSNSYAYSPASDGGAKTFDIGINIIYKAGTLSVVSTNKTKTGNGKVDPVVIQDLSYYDSSNNDTAPFPGELVPNGTTTYQPFEFSKTITIPANKYSPDNLVSTLNTLLQENTPDGTRLMNSKFLQTTSADTPAKLQEPGVATADQKEVYFINSDATDILKVNGGISQIYVGTNNFAFGWEATQGVFTIDYAHFPVINNADGSDAVALVKTTNLADPTGLGDYVLATKYGGIYFTSFSDNLDDSLIYKLMNFKQSVPEDLNPTGITAYIGQTSFNINPQTGKAPVFRFADGANTTSQLVTLDTFVNKKTGDNNIYYRPPVNTNNQITNDFYAQAPYTEQILANQSALTNTQYSGYFLVEVKAQFSGGKVQTPNGTLNFIRQVVGRYFTQDSYTTGESGQIVYTHMSEEPLLINSFHVRILDPSLRVSPNLGSGTTIFLAHVKNPTMMTPLMSGDGKAGAKAIATARA